MNARGLMRVLFVILLVVCAFGFARDVSGWLRSSFTDTGEKIQKATQPNK